jgi:hypothetical protein
MQSNEFMCAGGASDGKELILDDRMVPGDEILVPLGDEPGSFEVYAVADESRLQFVRRGRAVLQHCMDC